MKVIVKSFYVALLIFALSSSSILSTRNSAYKKLPIMTGHSSNDRKLITISDLALSEDVAEAADRGLDNGEFKKASTESLQFYDKVMKLNELIEKFKSSMAEIDVIKANQVVKIETLLSRLSKLEENK